METDFKKNGYCVIESTISNELKEFITQYALFDELQNPNVGDDWMVPTAHSRYGDPAMESLLLKIQPTIEKATGLELIPTYSYFRVYRNGDSLENHKDRDACEISCTLSFDFSYDNKDFQWPIFMDGNPVVLNPGDCVVYRGIDLAHWRDELQHPDENTWQVQGFFHYVDANGPHVDQAYDTRPNIGYPTEQFKRKSNQKIKKHYIEYT